jgi:hypothetical protein
MKELIGILPKTHCNLTGATVRHYVGKNVKNVWIRSLVMSLSLALIWDGTIREERDA